MNGCCWVHQGDMSLTVMACCCGVVLKVLQWWLNRSQGRSFYSGCNIGGYNTVMHGYYDSGGVGCASMMVHMEDVQYDGQLF
ncbi:hypothetical protein TanjilG_18621 [Lupinus angustifolius]|uniref:Uncharacterized protein n=1 Tax=Lupinus angustifolius TaxID=3871 RepID=A0A1J7HVU2_LUPAN|nr:hypothetical protein TanjilG_18620 [Lupinus angustifolius]OIW16933.1 hypothetical protein TanjilG_18621 [Lupinus angustifolius]